MEYVTHLREDGSYQPLKEHLEGTATRSAKFAASFGASSHAERTALLHDIGKYSPNGQRRQRDPEHTAKVDHSTAGAKAAAEDWGDMHAAFAIAGHHGGLPDLGTRLSLDDGTLCARLNNFNPRSPCGERLLKFESLFGFSNNSCMVIRFLAAPSSLL